MKKERAQLSKNQILVRTLLGVVLIAVAIFAAYKLTEYFENRSKSVEPREEVDDSTARLDRQTYNGVEYIENTDITTILLLGIDMDSFLDAQPYRDGGQADFIMLIVIDGENRTVKRLQIDRDTMTQIPNMTVLGKLMGMRSGQVALAHNFGANVQENNQYTVDVVENLIGGINIDLVAALYMGGIGELNDLIGGVTVLIEDDFSAFTDDMPMGQTITLSGKQAEIFTRSRYGLGGGTNEERMKTRQQTYIAAALDQLLKKCSEDANFAVNVMDLLSNSSYMVSDISSGRLINEVSRALDYTIMPIDYLQGTSEIGKRDLNEFYADDDWITQWVFDTYYIAQ